MQKYNLYHILVSAVTLIGYSRRRRISLLEDYVLELHESSLRRSHSAALAHLKHLPSIVELQVKFVALTGDSNLNSNGVCRDERVFYIPEAFKHTDAPLDIIDIQSWIDVMIVIEGDHCGMINDG